MGVKLFVSNTSPYARKARLLVAERRLPVEMTVVNPWQDPPDLLEWSPLGQVPVLVEAGRVLLDSRVICEYLAGGSPTWADRVRVATADGVMDAAIAIVLERRRPEGTRQGTQRLADRIVRTVASLAPGHGDDPSLGDMAVASALAYLDFRLPEVDWRSGNPALAAWHEALEQRPAFRACPLG